MKQIFSSAVLVFSFSICAAAQTSVEELLEKVDLLYRSNSSHATMEMKIVTENWERTTEMEVWSRGMEETLIKILSPSFNYQISPLWSLNSSAYFNLNDSSSQTISGLEWNISEDWLFSGSIILASGKNSAKPTQKISEFGDNPNSFQLMLKYYL